MMISDDKFFELKMEAVSKMKSPVLIIHPSYSDRFPKCDEYDVICHEWMPLDRIMFMDKSNLMKINNAND